MTNKKSLSISELDQSSVTVHRSPVFWERWLLDADKLLTPETRRKSIKYPFYIGMVAWPIFFVLLLVTFKVKDVVQYLVIFHFAACYFVIKFIGFRETGQRLKGRAVDFFTTSEHLPSYLGMHWVRERLTAHFFCWASKGISSFLGGTIIGAILLFIFASIFRKIL